MSRRKLVAANPRPCSACPWRLSNQGRKDDPHGFYTKANLKRLWDGLRSGEAPGMTCHPTDPEMAVYAGYEATADRPATAECAGSIVLLAREFKAFEALTREVDAEEAAGVKLRRGEALRRYRRARPRGMTREGLAELVFRIAVVMPGAVPIPRVVADDSDIGYPPLEPR